jgi:hypothetical protein
VPDLRCRVTVVGTRKQADVALPARASIGDYADGLAALVGEDDNDVLPPVWSLKAADRGPLPPHSSLESEGITDGQLLYLCDLAEGEFDEGVVLEVEERVAVTADRVGGPQWTPLAAASVTLIAGAAWLTAAVISWVVAGGDDGALALVSGVVLAGVAWAGHAERIGVKRPVRLVIGVSVVPCLGAVGWYEGLMWSAGRLGSGRPAVAVIGLVVGVVAGSLAALAAVPGIETAALTVVLAVAGGGGCLLVWEGAGSGEASAVGVVAGYGLIVVAPGMAVRLSAFWLHMSGERDTGRAVVWAHGLTLGASVIASAVAGISLVRAGAVRDPFDVALVAVVSCAFLLRVGTCRLLAEALPVAVGGLVGLFALALGASRYWVGGSKFSALAETALGCAMLMLGVILTLRQAALGCEMSRRHADPHALGSAGPGAAQVGMRLALTLCSVAVFPLLLGTFGVYGELLRLGRHL